MRKNKSLKVFFSYIQIFSTLLFFITNLLGCAGGRPVKQTALMIASAKGDIAIVRALLAEGTNVNQKDKLGKTALMRAAQKGYHVIVEALLEEGADVNARDIIGWTALKWAKEKGHIEITTLLKRAGAIELVSIDTQLVDSL